jgi:hypothetical protein
MWQLSTVDVLKWVVARNTSAVLLQASSFCVYHWNPTANRLGNIAAEYSNALGGGGSTQ